MSLYSRDILGSESHGIEMMAVLAVCNFAFMLPSAFLRKNRAEQGNADRMYPDGGGQSDIMFYNRIQLLDDGAFRDIRDRDVTDDHEYVSCDSELLRKEGLR